MSTTLSQQMVAVLDFLHCPTPESWIHNALLNLDLLLIDHAHCEKKAASSAMNLMYRYADKYELLQKMSRLAREELRHFEMVLALIKKRGFQYDHLPSSRYASGLRQLIGTIEPDKLVDTLIVGAIIEARSCERFFKLAPHLDFELQTFYQSLLKSESRHYRDYLELARRYGLEDIDSRCEVFLAKEALLITEPDEVFRFHSGPLD